MQADATPQSKPMTLSTWLRRTHAVSDVSDLTANRTLFVLVAPGGCANTSTPMPYLISAQALASLLTAALAGYASGHCPIVRSHSESRAK